MSRTKPEDIQAVLGWLETNAFWNEDLVEVRESKLGGVGVFWKLKDKDDPDGDRILLRIPKSNILSPKNSFIYNLLADYEPEDPLFDFTTGMHAIVVAFIYEKSLAEKSPWHSYIKTFDLNCSDNLPLCLWDQEKKNLLHNSECDMLNMLDADELIQFFSECVNFAKTNSQYAPVPAELVAEGEIDINNEKLIHFGRCVQAVISRAFTVDKYNGLSLVPGADLFNHLSPIVSEGQIKARENVHFVCDDEDLCELCGELECGHEELDDESEEDVIDDEDLKAESEDEVAEEDEEGDGMDEDVKSLLESDIELSADSEDEDDDDDDNEDDEDNEAEINYDEEEDKNEVASSSEPITMEQIEQMDNSDADTSHDDEEVSTLSMSDEEDGEGDGEENNLEEAQEIDLDLANELADGSKCCDIVLQQLPEKGYDYELFNTYGNELSNAYLLQKYGFVSTNNPNNTCVLTLQLLQWIKKEKQNKRKRAILEQKLLWYEEIGFEMVNEHILQEISECGDDCGDECGNHCGDHESSEHGCEDEDCGGCGDGEDGAGIEVPESWQLSPRIQFDGSPTIQTKALLNLLVMPFKVFLYKLAQAPSERKMFKRVNKYLISADLPEEAVKLITTFVQQRLARYNKEETKVKDAFSSMIMQLIHEEKDILKTFLEGNDS